MRELMLVVLAAGLETGSAAPRRYSTANQHPNRGSPGAMLISIIIATRNAAATLPRCLDSIRAQTWRDFEVLVMDGGSTDGTVEVLRGSADIVTLWRSAPDKGVFDAWNKALAHARGEWICFLGADDRLWDPGALERLVPYLRQAMPEFRVVYSKMRQVDAMDHVLQELGRPWPEAR